MEIFINKKPCQVPEGTTVFSLSAPDQNQVVIVNGFQTSVDVPLSAGDEVFFIPKDRLPAPDQLEAMMAARHSPGVFEKVKQGRVAIAGLGGLGSHIAAFLARTGVGELFLVDFDTVEPSNLNRQNYYVSHLGQKKTAATAAILKEINPYLQVKTQDVKVTAQNAASLFHSYPIVCEAFDDPAQKAMLINTLLTETSCTIVSGNGMAGFGDANTIQTTHPLSRLYLCGDGQTEAKPGEGLMAPRVAVCSGHQANVVLQLLCQSKE